MGRKYAVQACSSIAWDQPIVETVLDRRDMAYKRTGEAREHQNVCATGRTFEAALYALNKVLKGECKKHPKVIKDTCGPLKEEAANFSVVELPPKK